MAGRRPPIVIDEPDIEVPRQEVDSSCLSHVGYDPEQQTLYLTYRPTGMTYVYFDFTPSDFDQFMTSGSLTGGGEKVTV
jgi:hypothetical protein